MRGSAMSWTWLCNDTDGQPMEIAEVPSFSAQGDAESWLGEAWHELAEQQVAAVVLQHDGTDVYGPMSLEPPLE
jgi:hypothetical protein